MLERGVGAVRVRQLHAGGAQRVQLVDVVEAPLPFHLRPVAALDDKSRFHRGELALERRFAVAPSDFALDVRVHFPAGPA